MFPASLARSSVPFGASGEFQRQLQLAIAISLEKLHNGPATDPGHRETVAFRQKRKLSIRLTVQIERKSWFVCRQSQKSVCVKCSAVPHGPTSRGTCQLFGGLSVEETVEVLKISTQRVLSDWDDSWLMRELKQGH